MPKKRAPVWSGAKTKRGRRRLYLSLLPVIDKVALQCGYAIGVHGSLTRDLDLIAVPWESRHVLPETFALRVHRAVCRRPYTRAELRKMMRRKPWGRVSYLLVIGPNGAYIDLSIMPANR